MSRSTKQAFAFVWITVFLDMVGLGLIMPVLPNVLRALTGADAAAASVYGGWLLFAYAAMQFLCAPFIGALSDAIGRRPVLLVAVLGLGIDYATTAFAPTVAWLFVGRIVAGMLGASHTTAHAYVADVTAPEDRAKAFGILSSAFGVGYIVGPAIGGLLGDVGPKVPFFVAAGLSLANFVYGLVFLPETHPKERRKKVRLAAVNPFTVLGNVPGSAHVRTLAIALFVLFLGLSVYPSIWSFWAASAHGWSTSTIGLSLATYGICSTLCQAFLAGRITKKLGERRTAIATLAVNVAGFLLTAVATRTWMVFAITVLASPGGIAMPATNAWMSRLTPADEQGRLQGTIGAAESLSSIFGPIMMSQLFGATEHRFPGAPFLLAGALAIVALVVATRAPEPPPERGEA